jgi:hypothetical protein
MGKFLGWFVVVGFCVAYGSMHIPAQDKKKTEEKDLSGAWDGDADGKRHWGAVKLKMIGDEYIGTYTDTFNGKLGNMSFKRVGERKYQGLWWETSLQRYGSFELQVAEDGRTITLISKSLDDGKVGPKITGEKSTWKQTGK